MIEISKDEARLLAHALRDAAQEVRDAAERYPLLADDPQSPRYELFLKASSMRRRARELEHAEDGGSGRRD